MTELCAADELVTGCQLVRKYKILALIITTASTGSGLKHLSLGHPAMVYHTSSSCLHKTMEDSLVTRSSKTTKEIQQRDPKFSMHSSLDLLQDT